MRQYECLVIQKTYLAKTSKHSLPCFHDSLKFQQEIANLYVGEVLDHTPLKINMEPNHGGLEDQFLSKWVICRFHVNLPGCICKYIYIYTLYTPLVVQSMFSF